MSTCTSTASPSFLMGNLREHRVAGYWVCVCCFPSLKMNKTYTTSSMDNGCGCAQRMWNTITLCCFYGVSSSREKCTCCCYLLCTWCIGEMNRVIWENLLSKPIFQIPKTVKKKKKAEVYWLNVLTPSACCLGITSCKKTDTQMFVLPSIFFNPKNVYTDSNKNKIQVCGKKAYKNLTL